MVENKKKKKELKAMPPSTLAFDGPVRRPRRERLCFGVRDVARRNRDFSLHRQKWFEHHLPLFELLYDVSFYPHFTLNSLILCINDTIFRSILCKSCNNALDEIKNKLFSDDSSQKSYWCLVIKNFVSSCLCVL